MSNQDFELDELRRALVDLADEAESWASRVRGGFLDGARLLAERADQLAFRLATKLKSLSARARALGIDIPPRATLESITALIIDIKAQETRQNIQEAEAALSVLASIGSIGHRSGRLLTSLEELHRKSLALEHQLAGEGAAMTDELKTLAAGTHPFCRLLDFIRNQSEIADEDWARFEAELSDSFDKPLVVAALRGHLVIDTAADEIATNLQEPEAVHPEASRTAPMQSDTTEETEPNSPESGPDGPDPSLAVSDSPFPSTSAGLEPEHATHQQTPVEATSVDMSTSSDGGKKKVREEPSQVEATTRPQTDPRLAALQPIADRMPAATSAAMIARTILDDGTGDDAEAMRFLFWALMKEERYSLAWHLAHARSLLVGDKDLHEYLAAFSIAAPFVHNDLSAVVDRLESWVLDALDLLDASDSAKPDDVAARLVLFFALLRPSLLSGRSAASELLRKIQLGGALSALHDLRTSLLDLVKRGLQLTPAMLSGVSDTTRWQEEHERITGEAREWLATHRVATIKFQAATDVLRVWLAADGFLGQSLEIASEGAWKKANKIADVVDRYHKTKTIEQEIDNTDRGIRKLARTKPIVAGARKALLSRAKDALDLLNRWVEHAKARPESSDHEWLATIRKQRDHLVDCVESSTKVIDEIREQHEGHLVMFAACRVSERSLDGVKRLFSTEFETGRQRWADDILDFDLLRFAGCRATAVVGAEEVDPFIRKMLEHVARDVWDWAATFKDYVTAHDHESSGLVLGKVEMQGDHALEEIERMRARRDEDIAVSLQRLRDLHESTRKRIERAAAEGLLGEGDRQEFVARLQGIKPDDVLDFGPTMGELESICFDIAEIRRRRAGELRGRLAELGLQARDPEAWRRISEALEKEHYLAAIAYMDMVDQGRPLESVEVDHRDTFDRFFPEFASAVGELIEGPNRPTARAILAAMKARDDVHPLLMRDLPPERVDSAQAMMKAWLSAKDNQGDIDENLRTVFEEIGFSDVQLSTVDRSRKGRQVSLELSTKTIASQATCPIPAFGSMAAGRYRVVVTWRGLSESELVDLAENDRRRPTIVLQFGLVPERRRRRLAQECREQRKSLLVADDAVMWSLCQEAGSRLQAFFDLTLPFTVAEPYVTTASVLPVEMFYGREREIRAVFEPSGTNFVYGGRQLGKTAVLKEVERRFHRPEAGTIVRWIDLKAEGIGTISSGPGATAPSEGIWNTIKRSLEESGIEMGKVVRDDRIEGRIREWLAQDATRRIVLLLDEADAFLEVDSRPTASTGHAFPVVSRLKGLMDSTERRFKVVFAGLHNVQRTARDVNTPLAHLGDPICIGPLLEGGESRHAIRLIERPLRTLGYRFEENLSMEILSHTNFYPSLIQIFCWYLLDHVSNPDRQVFDPGSTPPYLITKKHVDAAFESLDVQQAILTRFRLTLNLDPRYNLVAHCIADASLEDRSLLRDGVGIRWIRDQALAFWAKGFERDSSFEALETIIEEMIGLGVLRRVGRDRFALRSANVLELLGNQDAIQNTLLDIGAQSNPPVYDAGSFRRPGRDPWRRSPLTCQQENRLIDRSNGALVLFGVKAAGLGDVGEFIQLAAESWPEEIDVDFLTGRADCKGLLRRIDDILDASRRPVSLLVVDGAENAWDVGWVNEAASRLEARSKGRTKSFLRVVFVGSSEDAWRWAGADRGAVEEAAARTGPPLVLRPWHDPALHLWLECLQIDSQEERRQDLLRITGNWPVFLTDFGTNRGRGDASVALQKHLKRLEDDLVSVAVADDFPVVEEAKKVLLDMAQFGEDATVGDIACLLDVDEHFIDRVLRYAELLHYVVKTARDRWRIDPIVAKVLAGPPELRR